MNHQRSIYRELLQRLSEKGVRYSLLRDTLPEAPELHELDILVWPEHRREFVAAAQELGFVVRKTGIPGKEVLAAFDGENLRLVDVHYAFIQEGLVYLSLPEALARLRKTPEGHSILSREDELLHLFYHNLLGKNHLQEKHLPRVRELLSPLPDLAYLKQRVPRANIWNCFEQFILHPETFSKDRKLAGKSAREIRRALMLRSPANWLRWFYNRRLRKRLHRRRGVHFAFMGVDGAGKSTIIRAVQQQLEQAGAIKFYTVYMGPWGQIRSPFMRLYKKLRLTPPEEDWLGRLREKLQGREKEYSLLLLLKKLLSGKIQGWLYYLAIYLEFWYRYFREVRPRLRKGAIVLSDRYIYDLKYIYKDRPVEQFKWLRGLVCLLYPRPDRVVYLQNDPDTIVRRKPQLNAGQIRQFQGFYRQALAAYPVLDVLTDRPPEALARQVVSAIMEKYLQSA